MKKILINYTSNQKQGYIAGGLFNEADVKQRLYEGEQLKNTDIEFYNPIEAPCNDKSKLPTADDIFTMDTEKVLKSDVIVADISTKDEGVMAELAIAWTCNYIHQLAEEGYTLEDILRYIPKKEIKAHLSDIRKTTSNQYENNYIPWGFNQYIIGMIENNNGKIYDSFDKVIEDINKDK